MKKMLWLSFFAGTILIGVCYLSKLCAEQKPDRLNVMSFNIWMGGGYSVTQTAKIFVESGADVIGVQESINHQGENVTQRIADSLGWDCHTYRYSQAIVSKHSIVAKSPGGNGVKIEYKPGRYAWIFSVHLNYCPYGPYQLAGIGYCGEPILSTAQQAIDAANAKRADDSRVINDDIRAVKAEGYPIFVTGDFNEPTYQDWTKDAVDAGLCPMVVEWPSVKTFIEKSYLIDSYREVNPDVVATPGHTWTPLAPTEDFTEVHDRIDFILYSKLDGNVGAVDSKLIGENSSLSDIRYENYPSDHRAVFSSFEIKY